MVTEVNSDYREYLGASDAELGFGSEKVTSRVIDYKTDTGQQIGVFVTEPIDGFDSTTIMPEQHDYRNEPLVMRRAEIIASQTHSRVVVVETPGTVGLVYPDDSPQGYGIYSSTRKIEGGGPTKAQLVAAVKGDFSEHASLQLDAVVDTLNVNQSDRLVLFGESMGAVASSEMVRTIGERGLQLNTLILHEVVNPSQDNSFPWLVSLLTKLSGVESERRNRYFDENTRIGHPIKAFEQTSKANQRLDSARKSFKQQGFASIANGIGMRTGIEPKLLASLKRFGSTAPHIVLSHGSDSTVASAAEYETLSSALKDQGQNVISWEFIDKMEQQEVGHFFLMSLGRQAAYAEAISRL